jgi:hypothetical protein
MAVREPKAAGIRDIRHITVAYSKDTYRGHPRHCGSYNFGGGELAITYSKAPCFYQRADEVGHDFSYMERADQVLLRSTDNGETWPESSEVAIWPRGAPIDELRARLWPDSASDRTLHGSSTGGQDSAREELDMRQPGACFFFGRCWAGKEMHDPYHTGRVVPHFITFSLRSVDKGRTWERVPTVIAPPAHQDSLLINAHPPVRLPDGTFLVVGTAGKGADPAGRKEAVLYLTDDNGLSWECITTIASDPTGTLGFTYNALIMLPGGRLQCYMMSQIGFTSQGNLIWMNYSDDGGVTWSAPRPIHTLGHSPWVARRAPGSYSRPPTAKDPAGRPVQTFEPLPTGAAFYRSPFPLLLRDGRIVVTYGRRKPPYGMGCLVSEDSGETWSADTVLRDDALCWDLGYPVTMELDDGRILTVYYYNLDDGNQFGGTRFIAGTFFRLV